VAFQSAHNDRARLDQDIRRIVNGIVGDRLDVTLVNLDTLPPQGNTKFRAVQSLVEQGT
jgi:hypothetical protein